MLLTPEDLVGDPVELFEPLEVLGSGSYGTVRKCLHKKTGHIVAVKYVEKGEDDIHGISKEIEVMKKCVCAQVVAYYGSFAVDSDLLIVMEYCAVGSCLDLMKIAKRTFKEDEIAAILAHVVKGLTFLHQRKVIHRDIKAGNILLTEKGEPKLADFGVAAQMQSTFSKRATVIGSPYWMPPEVIESSVSGYGSSADIWSLGITAIELAEGEPPLFQVHFARVIFMIPRNNSPTLKKPNEFSPEFVDFLSLCLRKDPNTRPSAEDLLKHPFIKRGFECSGALAELAQETLPEIIQARMDAMEALANEEDEGTGDLDTLKPLNPGFAGMTAGATVVLKGTRTGPTVRNFSGTFLEGNGNTCGTFVVHDDPGTCIIHPTFDDDDDADAAANSLGTMRLTGDNNHNNSGTIVYTGAEDPQENRLGISGLKGDPKVYF